MEEKKVKGIKGLFSLIKESLNKANSGCGPGCGCHIENKDKKEDKAEKKEK
ncbi:MAG: hypothetical protein OHK0040_08190 [bacterium]